MSKLRKGQSLTHPQNIALAWMARNGANAKWTIGPGREWVHLVMVSLENLGRVRFTDHGVKKGDGRPYPREAELVKLARRKPSTFARPEAVTKAEVCFS